MEKRSIEKIAKIGSMLSRVAVLAFALIILLQFQGSIIASPYSYYVGGLLISLFLYFIFNEARQFLSYRRAEPYDRTQLKTQNDQLFKLMDNLNQEIREFQNAVNYFFFGVRSFKYSTVLLAGLSTVILGLDMTGIRMPNGLDFTRLSKNIALVIGAVITIISTMAIYWNIEKYWLQNKIILQKFRELREEVEFADKKSQLGATEVNEYCERFKTIKKEFYKYWEGVQAERNK